jgi:hypothetical protein
MKNMLLARHAFQGFSLPTCPVCRDGAMQAEQRRTNVTLAACFTCGSTLAISDEALQRFLPGCEAATKLRTGGRAV